MPRYTNLNGTTPDDKSPMDLVKWLVVDRLNGKRPVREPSFAPPRVENNGHALTSLEGSLTWIGHSSFAMRLGGKLVLTDPIWSASVGMVRRKAPPGVAFADLPSVDIVTVSHAHYDHLDLPTLRSIGPDALYVVPKDVGPVLRSAGLPNVVELGWWESYDAGTVRITLVPAHHWSMRTPWDRNRRLWGGFVYEGPEGSAYHAGDTAYDERVFSEIAGRFGNLDWAMMPIGAYEPEWFMSSQHIGPEDAGLAWKTLRAKNFVSMHWGTFRLTDEPMSAPPARIAQWFENEGLPRDRLWTLAVGETRAL